MLYPIILCKKQKKTSLKCNDYNNNKKNWGMNGTEIQQSIGMGEIH